MPPPTPPLVNEFLQLLEQGRIRLARRETVSVATAVGILVAPNSRRAVLVVTNVSANQLDLAWQNAALAANAGEYQLQQRDTYIELYDTRAGGIGEEIFGTLHAVKTTGAGNVRVLEYEVYR